MKKSLVALAVLAASGAAMAQSSVTLYGVADVWVGSVKVDNGTTSTSTTSMISGGVSTSRWGMKGAEDLGGGLKAIFQFEQGVSVDSGAASNFGRQAYVGFSGDFGAVKLGLISSPFDNVQGASDAVFDSDLAPANNPGGGVFRTANDYLGKVGNTIGYESPNMSGFAAQISYSLPEKAIQTPTDLAETGITSLALTYGAGPLAAQFAYQKEDNNLKNDDLAYTRLGASYNFGVATAKASFGKVSNTGNLSGASTSEWQLGADFPVSATTTLSASYASSTDNATTAPTKGEVKRSGFGIAAAYGLSKRTTVYGGFKKVTDDQGSALDTKIDVFAVGVKHTF